MLKLSDYFESCKLFPLMGVDVISPIAEQLDIIMGYEFGNRLAGNILTRGGSVEEFSQLTTAEQTAIAKIVYMKNKQCWQVLFDYVEASISPWIESSSKTTSNYGKVVATSNSGNDVYNQVDKIAGFDSTEFSDNTSNEHETKYGKVIEDVNSGTDEVTVESRSQQAERLVDYAVKFWIDNGLYNTLIKDAVKTISLPLYESEEDE